MSLVLSCIFILTLLEHTVSVAPPATKAEVNYRLPINILPSYYNLTFKPYLLESDGVKRFTFEAEAYINIQAYEPNLSSIVLHSKNLSYTVHELYETADRAFIPISNVHEDAVTDKFVLNLASTLKTHTNYTLHFVFTGLMGDNMEGMYKSFYVDSKNNTRWLAATQFQTHYARRAFPCFDEPRFKATFDVAVERFRSFNSISNGRMILSKRIDEYYYRDVFATTPKISTYMLAFVVSDFTERHDVEGQFYIAARPEYYSLTEFALSTGRKLLAEYDKYTNVSFYEAGIDKMHVVAVPDFLNVAMENFGLLVYKEQYLLYDENSSSLQAKIDIVAMIAHEMAHMWFGDSVTCEWWSYTWLNEAFATYFQTYMTTKIFPELELVNQFAVSQLQVIFEKDSRNDTNPMTDLSAVSSDDLWRMFNDISYYKGGSVLRMIQHAIGETNFHRAIQEYLKTFKYSTTVPRNIFDTFKAYWPESSKRYADGVFSSFTEQVGYPVVKISIADNSESMTIEQKRFLLEPHDGSDGSLLYTIPFTYTTNLKKNFTSTEPHVYLPPSTDKMTINFTEPIKWVIGNIQETGFYRVNYNPQGWEQLAQALNRENWDGIHELNRAQYVDDLLALSHSGELSYDISLKHLNYLTSETSFLPWESALKGFQKLADRLGSKKDHFAFYILKMTQKAYDSLGFVEKPSDKALEIYLRNGLIKWNCKYGREDCIAESLILFRNMTYMPIPVNIRDAVYCTAMRDGTDEDFESLYQLLKSEPLPTELSLVISSLGCVRQKKLVDQVFKIILSDDIRRQDKEFALRALYSSNAENVGPVFEKITGNLEAFQKALGSNETVARILLDISAKFTTKEEQQGLEKLIKEKGLKFGNSLKRLKHASALVKKNVEWSEKRLEEVVQYLRGFSNSSPGQHVGVSLLTMIVMV